MLIHSSENPCPAVLALLEDSGLDPSTTCLDIDVRDEMFHYCLQDESGSREMALVQYFRTGIDSLRAVKHCLKAWFGSKSGDARVLDFASGYGRLTRFLVGYHPRERLWVAEIDADAIAFQEKTFGVHGIASERSADDLHCDHHFDFIFVGSLFSHLPRATFESWMRRLYELLAPSGLLLLTVNDQMTMLPERILPTEGFYFEELSESEFLDLDEYGSTWVTEDFMNRAIEKIAGVDLAWTRVPLGLWHRQDVYLLTNGGSSPSDIGLKRGVEGYLESCSLRRNGSFRFGGWAVDYAGGQVDVELLVNGAVVDRCRPDGSRPDVAELLDDERFEVCGWCFELPATSRQLQSSCLLSIRARTNNEPWYILYSGNLDTAPLYTSLLSEKASSRHQKHVLKQRISAMEASRFWRLRNSWFKLKAVLGLGNHESV